MLPYYVPPYSFVHYPEGLKGRYVASSSTAAHLGRGRVFSSRSEYLYLVSVDRKYYRRRRAWEVASELDDEDDESRPTSSAVRPCVRTEEESAEAIARIVHWQSTFALTADRELSYASMVQAEADSDIWVKVEYDELDPSVLFANPPSCPETQPPASPGVQILSRRPSFFADSPLPCSQLLVSASNVRVRIESEEPQLSRLAPASPLPIKSEPQSVDNLVLLGQQSQAGILPSPVFHAASPVHPRSVTQPRVKSEDHDESMLLLSPLRQVSISEVLPSLQRPVVTPLQWHAAPQQGPSPPPVVPFWMRAHQDVIMSEASEDNLRAWVVEPLHRRPGPAFSSFSAFAAAPSPQVAQGAPANPQVRIESRSEEDLVGLRMWHDGEPLRGTGPTTANTTPAPASPQPPATPASLFGGDDDDDDDDEPVITAVKPAPKRNGRKAREETKVQVKREPTEDADPLFDEIPQEDHSMDCSPPDKLPHAHTVSHAPAPLASQRLAGPLQSPSTRDVEMDSSEVQHTRLPHVRSVIRPLRIHDHRDMAARPQASPRIADITMEEDVQVVQAREPLRRSRMATIPVKAEPKDTHLTFNDDSDDEASELLRELLAMQRDPGEWYRRSTPPTATLATVKTEPTASDPGALVIVRVESMPSIGRLEHWSAPAVVSPLVKAESVSAALADLTLSSDESVADDEDDYEDSDDEDEGVSYGSSESDWTGVTSESTSEDADICSLAESLARLSIGSTSEALSSFKPLGTSDSVVSYLDVEDRAGVPSLESAAQEIHIAVSSGAAPPVKEEPIEVSLSTPVLASNATVICQSPFKRIIRNAESEEIHLLQTGQQSALLLRPSAETSGCGLDDKPDCEPPRVLLPDPSDACRPSREHSEVEPPRDTSASEIPVLKPVQEQTSSGIAASPSVFAAFLQRCTDAFYAQLPPAPEEDGSAGEEEAIEIYELYEALPTHDVRNVEVQLIANDLVDSRSAHAIASTAEYRAALEDTLGIYGVKPGQSPDSAPKLPSAVAVVLPSHFRYPDALSRHPRTDDKSNTADAVQGSGAPSSSLCPVSRDLKRRAKDSFWANWSRGCVQELGIIPAVGEDGKLGFEAYEGESPLPVVLSDHALDYSDGASLGGLALAVGDKAGLGLVDTGLALAIAPAPAAVEDEREDTVLTCAAGSAPTLARVSTGSIGDDDDSSSISDTLRGGNSDEDDDSWARPLSRSDKGKECLLLDPLADDVQEDDLGFDTVPLPEDYNVLPVIAQSPLSSSRPLRAQIHPRIRLPRRKVTPPASDPMAAPRHRASLPRAASHAVSLLKRCLKLKPR